ncbi:MAG: radical SAM protein [Deltaproteobacteria bacterium]|nr:radical SAM protein [Deltaproteobacteria bacterium]
MSTRILTFHLTDRCNLNCQHCIRDPAIVPKDLPVAVFERVLDQAGAYAITQVAITGGEPFLHPEIGRILDAIASRGMTWHAVSNGTQIDRLEALLDEVPSRRHALTRLVFSLDGAEEATHDRIRGEGSFREVMKAILRCVAWKLQFDLQMVLNAHNSHELEAFALQAAQLGAGRANLVWLHATGTPLDKDLFVPRRAWRDLRDRANQMAAVLRMPVSLPMGFPDDRKFVSCGPWQSEQMHVDVSGQMSLCCQLSGLPGSGARSDLLGDLGEISLAEGHSNMVSLVHDLQRRRIEQIRDNTLEPWDEMPCNWCVKQFGKPYWTDEGAAGAGATRERWRGAWANGATGRALVTRSESRVRLAVIPDAE